MDTYTKIFCCKTDFDNNCYPLKNAEFTVYKDVACTQIAKDINGNNCVGMTGNDGRLNFTVYNENMELGGDIKYWMKETKAPFGYKLNPDIMSVQCAPDLNDPIINISQLKMFNKTILIPPKTRGYDEYFKCNGVTLGEVEYLCKNGVVVGNQIWWYYYNDAGKPCADPNGGFLPYHSVKEGTHYLLVSDVEINWYQAYTGTWLRTLHVGESIPEEYRPLYGLF